MLYINGNLAIKIKDPKVTAFVPYAGAQVYSTTGTPVTYPVHIDNYKLYREATQAEKLENDKKAVEEKCTKVAFSEDFETNDVSESFTGSIDTGFYSFQKSLVDENNVLDLFVGKNGTAAGYGSTGSFSMKNGISGNSITELKVNFKGGFPEYGFLTFGTIGQKSLYIERDIYSSNVWRFNLGTPGGTNTAAISTLSAADATSAGMVENTDILFKAVSFGSGIFVYANNKLIGSYTGDDAANYVSRIGYNSFANYSTNRHVYMDDITIKTEPTFEEKASWYLINDNFDTYNNDRITPTEVSDNVSCTGSELDGANTLKVSMGIKGTVGYQIHSGIRIEAADQTDYVIETRMKADPNGMPQGLIIYTGRKDNTTGYNIGFAMTDYRHFYGMTAYGDYHYYDVNKLTNLTCGDDVGFNQTAWHTYKLIVNGNNIKVYIDNVEKINYTNDNMSANKNVGIRATSANFANHSFYVDSLSVKTYAAKESGAVATMSSNANNSYWYSTRFAATDGFTYDSMEAYVAIYEDGKLVKIEPKTIPMSTQMLSEKIEATYPKVDGKTYTSKLFTWDKNMKPVFDVQ